MLTATSIRAWPSLSGTIASRRSGESPRTGTVSSNEAIHCATPPLSAMLTRISEAPAGSGDSATSVEETTHLVARPSLGIALRGISRGPSAMFPGCGKPTRNTSVYLCRADSETAG